MSMNITYKKSLLYLQKANELMTLHHCNYLMGQKLNHSKISIHFGFDFDMKYCAVTWPVLEVI